MKFRSFRLSGSPQFLVRRSLVYTGSTVGHSCLYPSSKSAVVGQVYPMSYTSDPFVGLPLSLLRTHTTATDINRTISQFQVHKSNHIIAKPPFMWKSAH